jgi:hypothetical protein
MFCFLVLWTPFYSTPEQQAVEIVVKLYVSCLCLYICELAYLFLPFMNVCDRFDVVCCSCGDILPVMMPTVLLHRIIALNTMGWLDGRSYIPGRARFLFSITSTPALRPNQPPILRVSGTSPPVVEVAAHLNLLHRSRMVRVELYLVSAIRLYGVLLN